MRKIISNILLLFLFIQTFISCSALTTITSWKDESFNGSKLKKILVIGMIKDLEFRTSYENELVKQLKNNGIEAVASLKLISPVIKYSKEDFDTLLQKNNFDGMLSLKYEGTNVVKTKRDGTTYYKYYRKYFRTIYKKGYIETHKTVIMENTLFSVDTEKEIWVSTAKTTDASNATELANSLSESIIKNLKENNLIK